MSLGASCGFAFCCNQPRWATLRPPSVAWQIIYVDERIPHTNQMEELDNTWLPLKYNHKCMQECDIELFSHTRFVRNANQSNNCKRKNRILLIQPYIREKEGKTVREMSMCTYDASGRINSVKTNHAQQHTNNPSSICSQQEHMMHVNEFDMNTALMMFSTMLHVSLA